MRRTSAVCLLCAVAEAARTGNGYELTDAEFTALVGLLRAVSIRAVEKRIGSALEAVVRGVHGKVANG